MENKYDKVCAGVPVLERASAEVSAAAEVLVEVKVHLDALNRTRSGSKLAGTVLPDWSRYQSLAPFSFATHFLPFFDSQRRKLEDSVRYKALIPTEMVIGDSWSWRPENLNASERANVVATSFQALAESDTTRAGRDCAEYAYIKPLGIVLAHEGKNRVALFKELSLPHIPALVSNEGYPEAARIQIFELPGACLAVLDGRFVERVNGINLVRELLSSYGVSIERKWPTNYPQLESVIAGFDDARFNRGYGETTVDMVPLKIDAAAASSEVDATLLDLKGVRLPNSKFVLLVLAALLLLLVGIKLSGAVPDLRGLLAFAAGALSMLLTVPFLPLLKCRVSDLKDQLRWNQMFETKRRFQRGVFEEKEVGPS